MEVDYGNFEKEDFSINGFYRGFVEDNEDPLESGRVRVRILGIHSLDPAEVPTANLPWAEPVLPLSYSGGANLQNVDILSGDPIPAELTKYAPTPVVPPLTPQIPTIPSDLVTKELTDIVTIEEHKDVALCNAGSGGHFTVPAQGSLVW